MISCEVFVCRYMMKNEGVNVRNITIDDGEKIESLNVDFNRRVVEIITMLEMNSGGTYISHVNEGIIDIDKSFKKNNLKNNDVIIRGEDSED